MVKWLGPFSVVLLFSFVGYVLAGGESAAVYVSITVLTGLAFLASLVTLGRQ